MSKALTTKPGETSKDVACTYDSQCGANMLCRNGVCTQSTPTSCPGDVTPAIDFKAKDRFTGAELTDYSFLYRRMQASGAWGAWQTGYTGDTNIAGSPGDKLQFVVLANGTFGYGKTPYTEYIVPCLEDPELWSEIGLIATAGSMSTSTWNQDGSVNSATNAQAFSTSDTKNVGIEIRGHFQKQYGLNQVIDPTGKVLTDEDGATCRGSILVFEANKTVFVDMATSDLETATMPEQVDEATGYDYYAFAVPEILSNTEADGTGKITFAIESDTTVEPTVLHNITWTLYDCQVYQNTKDYKKIEQGTESYTGNADVGIASELTGTMYTS